MDVTFKRTGERRYGVFVARPEHPDVEMNPAPSYDDDLPHDFIHFVVEEELGLARGVFGQLAAGGDSGTFRIAHTGSDAREIARARRRQKTRGKRLTDEGSDEGELSERAATICQQAWLERFPSRERLAKARKLEAFVQKVRAESTPADLEALSEPVIERICERLERLSERWAKVEVGQSISLTWSLDVRASSGKIA